METVPSSHNIVIAPFHGDYVLHGHLREDVNVMYYSMPVAILPMPC